MYVSEETMEDLDKENATKDSFTDFVFSWSIEDICNENLYKNQVEKIPASFQSVQQYFESYVYPLLEEPRAEVHSSLETFYRAPFAEAQEHYYRYPEMVDNNRDNWLVVSLSSGLNESQTGTILACLKMLHYVSKPTVQLIWGPPGTGKIKTLATLLFTLLKMNIRNLVCAPTNVVTEVASHILKMVTEAESNGLFCPLGETLLLGNNDRLKVGSGIEDIYLDYHVKRPYECLGPQTGWTYCFATMIGFLEDCVSHYIFSMNDLTKEIEHSRVTEMMEKKGRCNREVSKGKYKTFLEFFRDRFVSTTLPLRYCLSIFCTHIAKNFIRVQNIQNMASLICVVDSFESLSLQGNVDSEALEDLFSRSEVEDVSKSRNKISAETPKFR